METKELAKFKKWMRALRSGKYSQGVGSLQSKDSFCCLGVACKVLIPPTRQKLTRTKKLFGAMPIQQRNAPRWLKEIPMDFYNRTQTNLDVLNDAGIPDKDISRLTFDEIADLLEAVYIHKVLDHGT